MTLYEEVVRTATLTRDAAREAAALPMKVKETILVEMAKRLRDQRSVLQSENSKDLEAGRAKGLSDAMMDRLTLSDNVIDQTADGLEEIAAFADPVGEVVRMWTRPNGMRVGRMRIPLGVIGIARDPMFAVGAVQMDVPGNEADLNAAIPGIGHHLAPKRDLVRD